MRLRSKGGDKQRIDDELEAKEDSSLLRLGRPNEGLLLGERKELGGQPQSLLAMRRGPTDGKQPMLSYTGNGMQHPDGLSSSKDLLGRPLAPQSEDRPGEQRSMINSFTNNPAQPAGSRPFQGNSTSFESNINTFYSMNNPVILPTCSSWFDINGIHQIEKDALPEFFTGKQLKTPQAYKNFRNHIIKLYREDPKNYLTATMCRRNIAGDACSILRIHAFLEHWGLVNFNFNVKNHNFNSITSSIDQNVNNFEAKMDPLLKEKKRIDPNCENDAYFHTMMSISRKIRPICDYSGLPCGSVWYIRQAADESAEDGERKEFNSPSVVILSQESFESGKVPKCYDPKSFRRETLTEKLERANKGKQKWSQEELEQLLATINECKDGNFEPLFKKFSQRSPEEVVFQFLQLPFSKVTGINIFGQNKKAASKSTSISVNQREAINTLIAQDANALDDYNNPIIQHAAVFKMFVDKVKSQNQLEFDRSSFKHERNPEADGLMAQMTDITAENRETILELESHLVENAQNLKEKAENDIKSLLKMLIEHQLSKIEQKVAFLDEYEKYMFHELKLLDLYRNHLKVERIKQEKEIRV